LTQDFKRLAEELQQTQAILLQASQRLAQAKSIGAIVEVLRQTARAAVGAEGIAVVLREAGRCFYVAEDAVAPLWAGQRFAEDDCISGWAMQHQQTAAIADVREDPRIPGEAYAPTFVRSLVMAPIGRPQAVAALGAYWSTVGEPDAATVSRVECLAQLAEIALENGRLQSAAEESQRQHELIIEAGRIGLWSLDIASEALETSATCRINFGRDPALPFSYAELHAAIHEDDHARVRDAIGRTIATGCDYDIEYRVRTPAGDMRWIGIRAQPAHGRDGRPHTLAGVSIDITARKRMEEALKSAAATLQHLVEERTQELVATQDALRQAQKLEAMGQLTGGVAHDFNNLLTPIMGSLDLLRTRRLGGEREQRLIDGALQSADRARVLVQRLLAFARKQALVTEPVDLAALVRGISELIATTLGPQVAIDLDLAPDLPPAIADGHQMEMALINLAVNARDAMPDGGRLHLSLRLADGTAGPAGLATGPYLVLAVSDTGEGMDAATRARAIEPFFSTKGVNGTGLGLSMVHGLASQLGGALAIDSTPGAGTTVRIWLPAGAETHVRTVPAVAEATPTAGIAMLVDDDDLVRMTSADMLEELGFEVIEASSAGEALTWLRECHPVDVVITDYMMPHMTGAELVQVLAREQPGLPVLIITGFSEISGIDAAIPRLAKPFRQDDLAAQLSALLTTAGLGADT
jgi:PAS domain S-box-containing protein